jgi:hypothetical protein
MSKYISVALRDGRTVTCAIVERSYYHDASARAAWCSHDGREFVAVRHDRGWREWDRGRSVAGLRGAPRG